MILVHWVDTAKHTVRQKPALEKSHGVTHDTEKALHRVPSCSPMTQIQAHDRRERAQHVLPSNLNVTSCPPCSPAMQTTQWDPPATTPYQAQLLQSQCVHEDRNSPGHPPQHVDPYVAYAVDFQHQPLSAEGCTDRHPSPSRFGHSQIADPHLHATYEGQRPTYANPERHEAHNAQQVMSRDQAHESPSFHQAQLPGGHGAPLQYNMIGAEYSRQHQQSQQHMQGGVSSQQGTAPAHVPVGTLLSSTRGYQKH